ncbi:MAG: prepilin-type N-terminal cleavage/methylation domain-containing protein [Candidatus Aminicenantes bacterium]|nr:prepilin-type N-terminal cleavage/methylation domain-containing protein [Candidatus Aminicenantes bacterium]
MLKEKNGFSLIELLLVLVLIGIFVGMTVNFSYRNKDRWALRDTAREITSVYYQAKQRAARENASVRIDVTADHYAYYWDKAGTWEALRNEPLPKNITASSTANFLINPSGFILDPATLKIAGSQTITLQAPRGADFDTMTITIYPYGGLRVEKVFK